MGEDGTDVASMTTMAAGKPVPHVGVVLAGAAALGAYEVGVVAYVLEEVARDLGVSTMPSVLSGTSAGGINASAFAAFADVPATGARMLTEAWSELRLDQTLRPSSIEMLSMLLDLTGAPVTVRRAIRAFSIRGGILDPRPIAKQIAKAPLARIGEHLRTGRLRGVAVSATRVANGEAVVFHDGVDVQPWLPHELVTPVATRLTLQHVLASAAIPLLFPAVKIGTEVYCDGGLRQMVPLSPAIHLGATRLLVVNPLPPVRIVPGPPNVLVTSPLYLAGKALNALFADRVEVDLARLEHTNAILRAGRHRFGPSFERELNLELARENQNELHEIAALCIEPSRDIGVIAADYVRSRTFEQRAAGPAAFVLRWLADGDPERAGDLLGYLMFDGGFTGQLVELGRTDARAHHEELCALFAPVAPLAIKSPA
jgi:NTE family protein